MPFRKDGERGLLDLKTLQNTRHCTEELLHNFILKSKAYFIQNVKNNIFDFSESNDLRIQGWK